MKCPRCGREGVIMEGLGDGKVRESCQSCGWNTIRDHRGAQLLTEVPQTDKRRLLTENWS